MVKDSLAIAKDEVHIAGATAGTFLVSCKQRVLVSRQAHVVKDGAFTTHRMRRRNLPQNFLRGSDGWNLAVKK